MKRALLVVMLAAQGRALSLAELERMAVAASPTLAQSESEVRAAAGRALQAGAYPNPVVGASGDHVAGGPILRGGDLGVFVEQRVVMAGKLGLQRGAAEQGRVAASHLQEAERLRVLTTIRALYYRALGEQRLIALRKDMAALAGRTAKTRRELANWGKRIVRTCWRRTSKRSARSWEWRWRGMRSIKLGARLRLWWGSRT